MLSFKDLVFKERPVKKLTEIYVRLYVKRSNIKKHGEVEATSLYKNSSGGKC